MTDLNLARPAPALLPAAEPPQLQNLRAWLAKSPSASLRAADVRWVVDQLADRLAAPAPTAVVESPAAPTAGAGIAAYVADIHAEIDRHGGDIATAAAIVIGAATACWANLAGAGEFESTRAAALVGVLLERAGAAQCACNTTEQRTHLAGEQAFCTATRTEGPGTPSITPDGDR